MPPKKRQRRIPAAAAGCSFPDVMSNYVSSRQIAKRQATLYRNTGDPNSYSNMAIGINAADTGANGGLQPSLNDVSQVVQHLGVGHDEHTLNTLLDDGRSATNNISNVGIVDHQQQQLCTSDEFCTASTSTAEDPINIVDGVSSLYRDLGDCTQVCVHCDATFWYDERLQSHFRDRRIHYHKCCHDGRVTIPSDDDPPEFVKALFQDKRFMENIRAYNQMFSMTSFGARIDESINTGRSPYVFKISGQIYHWIGSLCPPDGDAPRFLQLYIYDTEHEVNNRMSHFGGADSGNLSADIVRKLIELLDTHNKLVQLFRTAREKCLEATIPSFRVRLFGVVGSRQHDLPTSNNLGAIVQDSGPKSIGDYDVIIECKGGTPQRVNKLHPCYMSLQFPLVFIYGQTGFHLGMTLRNPAGSRSTRAKKLTMNMYYSYQLHQRSNRYNLLMRSGRLFQQYVVTVYCSIELDRIDYIRSKQNDIRNEYLSGLYDALNRGDQIGSDVGSRVILPASFTGGPRYMYSHYLDALAICRVHGNPQFFITFTCNSKWPEVRRYMSAYPALTPADRPDIVVRIFEMRVRQFVTYLRETKPFGQVKGALYTIEFQKRGLPHCHMLLWIHTESRSFTASDIDKFICAELPDPEIDPIGYKVVSELMVHGPCGLANTAAPCMQEYTCSKNFPKLYNNETFFDKDGYVHYRRRKTQVTTKKLNVELDNSYVVPYNLTLCLTFHAHINVEYCGWSMLIKYLFKYISKGTDRIAAQISKEAGDSTTSTSNNQTAVDEIQNFIDARFICPCEACWRIFNFPIHYRDPPVQILAVHLEDMQVLSFRARQRIRSVVNDPDKKRTTLTEWLCYNREADDGKHLTYLEFPSLFRWDATEKRWVRRKSANKPVIGRLSFMHPTAGEVFYLRMLLCHQRGATNFIDLRKVDRRIYPTYRAACEAMGLLGDDREWTIAIEEAAQTATAAELRKLFTHILLFCDVSNPLALWKQHWRTMSDDIPLRAALTLHMR